jgi:hypothetical protein
MAFGMFAFVTLGDDNSPMAAMVAPISAVIAPLVSVLLGDLCQDGVAGEFAAIVACRFDRGRRLPSAKQIIGNSSQR